MFEFRNHFETFCIIFRFFDMNKSCSNPLAAPERKTPCRWTFSLKPNSTMIFLTVCTRHRIPVLAQDPVHDQLRRLWSDPTHWRVGRYVIMPDHCHLLVTVGAACKVPLPRWISWWKRDVAMKIKSVAWHKDFWDHVVRSEEAFVEFENYMRLNPVRRHLACGEDEWRYQGEVYRLRW